MTLGPLDCKSTFLSLTHCLLLISTSDSMFTLEQRMGMAKSYWYRNHATNI